MKKKLLLLLLVFHSFFQIQAQTNSSSDQAKVWTLRECIDYGIKNNLTIHRSEYNVENSLISKNMAMGERLPTVNGFATFGYNWGRTIDPTTNLFVTQRVESINMGLSGNLLLWNGFRLLYNYKQLGIEYEAANEDLLKAKNDLILNIISLYLNIVVNKELLKNAESQLNSTQQELLRTRKMAEAGSVPRSDVLNMEAQLASNELTRIQQENAVNLSFLQLKQALQLPASTPMDIEIPEVEVTEALLVDQSAEEIFEIATTQMPEIKSAKLKQESSVYAFKSARGSYYPSLTLQGSLTTIYSDARQEFIPDGGLPTFNNTSIPIGYVPSTTETVYATEVQRSGSFSVIPIGTQFGDNLGRNVGLNLQIPLFNGFRTRNNVKRAAINKELSNINYLEIMNQLRQSVELAYNDALAAAKMYNASLKQEQARSEAFRMTEQRKEVGAANYIEYQISQNELFQAQSDLVRAKYDFFFRSKVLDFYQGKELDF